MNFHKRSPEANASGLLIVTKNPISSIVGGGVPDDPSGKSDLDGSIFPHTELPPGGGRDVEDAIPYSWILGNNRPDRHKRLSVGAITFFYTQKLRCKASEFFSMKFALRASEIC